MPTLNLVQDVFAKYKPKKLKFSVQENEFVEFQFMRDASVVCVKYEEKLERISVLFNQVPSSYILMILEKAAFKKAGRYQVLKVNRDDGAFIISMLAHVLECIDYNINLEEQQVKEHSEDVFTISGDYTDSHGNRLEAPNGLHNCKIQFVGVDNQVFIDPDTNIRNVTINCLGNSARIHIGAGVRMSGNWRLGFDCSLTIKDRASSTNDVYMTCAEQTEIVIGEDCMFATNNQLRTDDAHAIYDVTTGARINKSTNIYIGDHVWISYGATIFGGTNIGSGSVVGAFSLTNKEYPNNVIIAGTPAKVVREDVCWERPNVLYAESPLLCVEETLKSDKYYKKTNNK